MRQPDSPEPEDRFGHRTRFRAFLFGGGLLLAGAVAVAIWLNRPQESSEQLVQQARTAFERADYETAYTLAARVLNREPANGDAALLAGRSALRLNRFETAVACFDRVPRDRTSDYIEARNTAGFYLLMRLYQPSQAEKRYRDVLAVDGDNATANHHMAFLLGLASRGTDSLPTAPDPPEAGARRASRISGPGRSQLRK